MNRFLPVFTALLLSVVPIFTRARADGKKNGSAGLVRAIEYYVAEFAPGEAGRPTGRRTPLRSVTYDANGNVIEEAEYDQVGSAVRRLVYTYDAQGRSTGYEEFSPGLSAPRNHVYVLDGDGRRSEYRIIQPDGSAGEKCLYQYDAAGRLTEEALHDHKGALISRNVYVYDGQGRQVSQVRYNADGSVSATGTSSYDAGGRLVERVRFESNILTYRVRYIYDFKGRLVEQETVGSVVEPDVLPAGTRAPGRVSYVYQGKERPRETIEYAPDGSVREKVRIEYDSRGNWIKKTHLIQQAGSSGSESRRVEYRTITYF